MVFLAMRLGLLLMLVAAGLVRADLGNPIDDLIASSRVARAEGIPQGRVAPLETALSGQLPPDQRRAVAVELARCLLDANRETEAVATLDDPALVEDPEVKFWLAQSLAQAGEFDRALTLYTEVAGIAGYPRVGEALLGKARMLEASGQLQEALLALGAVPRESRVIHPARLSAAALLIEAGGLPQASLALESIRDPSRRDGEEKTYLKARVLLDRGENNAALAEYARLDPRNRRLAAGLAIGEAEARLREGDTASAERQLETFIRDHPRSPLIGDLMRKLDEVYAASSDPVNAELKRFELATDHPPLAALATFYLARNDERQNRADRAAKTYREFIRDHPGHRLRGEATVHLASLLLADGQLEAAVRALAEARAIKFNEADTARVEFLWGLANFRAGNFAESARHFRDAATGPTELQVPALANAALASGYSGDGNPADLAAIHALDELAAESVELAVALRQGGATGSPSLAALRRLSRDAKNPAVRNQARLGIAEWNWLRGARSRARSNFRQIANGTPTEQTDYFEVYAADNGTPTGDATVTDSARRFVATYPTSKHLPDVRMKWGEILARSGDHRGARVQFETAANLTSEDSTRATALFLAGRSAAQLIEPAMLEEAVSLFEDARQIGGPLAEQALFEQALLFNALDRPDDAIGLLDQLARSQDDRTRIAALLKKGDTLYQRQDADDAAAVDVWRGVAADPGAAVSERNEALAKAASAQEQAGDFDAALAGYYEVLEAPRDTEPEYFWYYKAGFDAARLLIERDQLKEAGAIFEKMAATKGPRSAEAADRVKALRLENFIWDK